MLLQHMKLIMILLIYNPQMVLKNSSIVKKNYHLIVLAGKI